MKVDPKTMSPAVQSYDRGDFFYDFDNSDKDGFVFVTLPTEYNTGLSSGREPNGYCTFCQSTDSSRP
jgi:hypothetical protein